jgi:hypothetical protein
MSEASFNPKPSPSRRFGRQPPPALLRISASQTCRAALQATIAAEGGGGLGLGGGSGWMDAMIEEALAEVKAKKEAEAQKEGRRPSVMGASGGDGPGSPEEAPPPAEPEPVIDEHDMDVPIAIMARNKIEDPGLNNLSLLAPKSVEEMEDGKDKKGDKKGKVGEKGGDGGEEDEDDDDDDKFDGDIYLSHSFKIRRDGLEQSLRRRDEEVRDRHNVLTK